jgi:hypothetical protein
VQRSDDGVDFTTLATVTPIPNETTYAYSDPQDGFARHKYYRIRATMSANYRQYTSVVNVNFSNKVRLMADLMPNPFASSIQAELWLKSANSVNARMMDQSGRTVYTNQFSGKQGDNRIRLESLSNLKPGVYIVEMRVQDEVLREKVIKQ